MGIPESGYFPFISERDDARVREALRAVESIIGKTPRLKRVLHLLNKENDERRIKRKEEEQDKLAQRRIRQGSIRK